MQEVQSNTCIKTEGTTSVPKVVTLPHPNVKLTRFAMESVRFGSHGECEIWISWTV